MAWTLNDYLNQLRNRLDEVDSDLFTDEELTAYINEGIQKIAQDLKLKGLVKYEIEEATDMVSFDVLFKETTEEMTEDEIASLPHNFTQLHSLHLNGQKYSVVDPDFTDDVDFGCYFWGDTINFLNPVQGNLVIRYVKTPKFLRDSSDTTDIPERYQDIPLEFAIAKAKQKDGEYGLYDHSFQTFEYMRNLMRLEIERGFNSSTVSTIIISDYNY